ncbi:nicotinamide riboside transporter PnuC [Pedobacter frigidisoli]|uniref:Nicotinamide riboside transporter PnuC n=1 Tax=Pedobacter frigidisoli TaxID=2530455 RepID=A0A4R0P227_9SPHI|nr:nicotinamide riboside transporter PnuC [Pedobacter frigidisoli]TCD10863.1 nicotinamide riboside transporter PnuC [Pedobacter frigidisoli]
MDFFNSHIIFFTVLDYEMSYLEFFAVITGIISVILSAKANIWSWPVGIVNVFLSAFFYYQIQLYPDMFLMVFFFVTNIVGWYRWANPKPEEADKKKELRISFMPLKHFLILLGIGILGTFLIGTLASKLHSWLPFLFNLQSAYPFVDSFILVMSVITTFLMIQKRIECWIIWLIIDVVATYLYFLKGAKFFGIEYLIFTIIAAFALWNWIKEYRSYSKLLIK